MVAVTFFLSDAFCQFPTPTERCRVATCQSNPRQRAPTAPTTAPTTAGDAVFMLFNVL